MIKKLILLILVLVGLVLSGCDQEIVESAPSSSEDIAAFSSEIIDKKEANVSTVESDTEDIISEVSSEITVKKELETWSTVDSVTSEIPSEVYENDLTQEEVMVTEKEEIKEPESSVEETGSIYTYSESDLDLLARLIYAEAGSYWITDEHQMLVGCVVLNRVNSSHFPNTIYDVIYQPGQYPPAYNGGLYNTPDERTYENARKVLSGEYSCPSNVVWQAGFIQGDGVYMEIYDDIYGSTYFCYSNY